MRLRPTSALYLSPDRAYHLAMPAPRASLSGAATPNLPQRKVYRRPAPPAETARRKAWGKKWGALVSQATKNIRSEGK